MPEKWILIGKNFEIPLADEYCEALGIEVGDILFCESLQGEYGLTLSNHHEQSLSDEKIARIKNLTWVINLK